MKRTLTASAVVVTVLAVALPVATASLERASATTTVSVTGKEFSFKLSRKSGPRGTFVFKFKNVGSVNHDFKIAGKKTPLLKPGASAKLTVKIMKAGRYRYLCTVAGHATAGMKGIFTVK